MKLGKLKNLDDSTSWISSRLRKWTESWWSGLDLDLGGIYLKSDVLIIKILWSCSWAVSVRLVIQILVQKVNWIVRRSPPRHSPPQTFTTSSVKSDVHHPQCKIRRSPPRHTPPQRFTTSDIHHPRHSPPQTFTTPYSKMRHSPPTNIHHPLQWLMIFETVIHGKQWKYLCTPL